jgi:hypothetical protein
VGINAMGINAMGINVMDTNQSLPGGISHQLLAAVPAAAPGGPPRRWC